jgi:hypothetical protein
MGNLLLRLPADSMAEVDAALKPRVERAFADARDAGRFESHEAYTADVVRDLLLGGGAANEAGPTKRGNQAVRPEKKVIALIDVPALNRGRVEGDEICEIAGVGPVRQLVPSRHRPQRGLGAHPRDQARRPPLAVLALPRPQDPPRPPLGGTDPPVRPQPEQGSFTLAD